MGLLPWDDWFYNLPWMRDQVNQIHAEAVHTQDQVQANVLTFNAELTKYKTLVASNALLVLIESMVQMDDLKLSDFTAEIQALPDPVTGDIVLNFITGAAEMIGGYYVLKGVVNLAKLGKDAIVKSLSNESETAFEDIGEEAIEAGLVNETEVAATESLETVGETAGEAVTEGAIEGASMSTLAATGIGIFAAVGVDAIFGAINGAKERDELQKQIDMMNAALSKVQVFLKQVATKTTDMSTGAVSQMNMFKEITARMLKILPANHQPAAWDWNIDSTMDNLDKFLAAQATALNNFGLLTQLRNTYERAQQNGRHPTKAGVIGAVLLSAPDWVTEDTLNAIWDQVLAKYSTLMASAK